ncbi:jasmonate ZIM domain-containing protein 1-like [Rutidosis leptorrhynchoides]|uniref:jasmonate ZIM domain-containing protein 1-like n=1 Tax=Rutidosis leptorrhynchoides TaxID=125765 RepID=UPI003A99B393
MSSAKTSTFAKTFNRLNSFLKEKGSLKDLGIINANFDIAGKHENETTTVDLLSHMEKSTNSLPQCVNLNDVTTENQQSEQMTIFYEGKVIVFDCISSDKAKNVMLAASRVSSNNQMQNRVQLASTSDCEGFGLREQMIIRGLEINGSDLPIARRASLHKFLAKRRDRGNVRVAPYELQNPSRTHKFDLNL